MGVDQSLNDPNRLSTERETNDLPIGQTTQSLSNSSQIMIQGIYALQQQGKRMRSDQLPLNFYNNQKQFSSANLNEYIEQNQIPVFTGDYSDLNEPIFSEFWNWFYERYHCFTYESFPIRERIRALLTYTNGSAKTLILPYQNEVSLERYTECIKDLYLRWGSTDSILGQLESNIRNHKLLSFSRNEVETFLAKVQGWRLKLISAGVNSSLITYQATIHIYQKLPTLIQLVYCSMYCTDRNFLTYIKSNPEKAYETLRLWVINNAREIEQVQNHVQGTEQAGGASSCQANLTQSNDYRCNICETNIHHWMFCPLHIKERAKLVRMSRRCFNCLRIGHMKDQCKSTKTCRNCILYGLKDEHHHTALCGKKSRIPKKMTSTTSFSSDESTSEQDRDSKRRKVNQAESNQDSGVTPSIQPDELVTTSMVITQQKKTKL